MAEEKLLKTGLSIRGDSYYCPLSFQLDTYWNCETNCTHCFLRRMNRTWGADLRPLDLENFKKTILNGLKSKSPDPLKQAIRHKKTLRIGNKTDPYQNINNHHKETRGAIEFLLSFDFSMVIQTKFTQNMLLDFDIWGGSPDLVSIMPLISPGLDRDWELFEHKIPTAPTQRLKDSAELIRKGFNVGVNGEPFIPSHHTLKDFEETLKALKAHGVRSYNTYFLHMNDFNLKALHAKGLDIQAIWEGCQDANWRKTLQSLIDLSKKHDIILGCPDFVNAGSYQETANTCCGIRVNNPCTWNVINWKKLRAQGMSDQEIVNRTWDGVGDFEEGVRILRGEPNDKIYNLSDIRTEEEAGIFK